MSAFRSPMSELCADFPIVSQHDFYLSEGFNKIPAGDHERNYFCGTRRVSGHFFFNYPAYGVVVARTLLSLICARFSIDSQNTAIRDYFQGESFFYKIIKVTSHTSGLF